MVSRVALLLALGLISREAFSFWTGSPYDFELWVRTGYWVVRGVSPYVNVPFAPGLSFANDFGGPLSGVSPALAYLPFWPLVLGAMYEVYVFLGSPSPLLYYFLIKQPLILFDVLLAHLLYRFLHERRSEKALWVLKVWLFSPYTIILSGIGFMFEAIPMVFVIFSLTARPGTYRGFWAGVATFVKSIPVVYTIPLSRGPKAVRNVALAIAIPVLASLLVIWLAGWPFPGVFQTLQSTVGKGGLGRTLSVFDIALYLNYMGVLSYSSLLAIETWVGYAWIPGLAIVTVLSYRWFGFDTERGLVQSLLLITLTFLLVRVEVNEQYALYLFALGLIDVAMWSPRRKNLLLESLALVVIAIVTNDVLLIRFLAPVYPQAVALEASVIGPYHGQVDLLRRSLLFLEAMIFSALNVCYFRALYSERHASTRDTLVGG